MTRRVFFSFYYSDDASRVQQIKNMGVVEGQRLMNSNKWEEVKRQGDLSIKRWINSNMKNTSCTVVLIGQHTSERKWVKYEIEHSLSIGKPIFGIYIDDLKDFNGSISPMGSNPFIDLGHYYIDSYRPHSYDAYGYIKDHFNEWVENAVK